MTRRRTMLMLCLVTLLASLGLIALAPHAYAIGDGNMGDFSCSDGAANGQLYVSNASCPTSLSKDHLFSFITCNMEQLSSNLMGNMFCGMQQASLPAIQAVLALVVVMFGAAFTIGVVPLKASEFQKILLKIAIVFVFATEADYLIGYGYNFLISGIREGVETVLSGYFIQDQTEASTGLDMYGMLDGALATAIGFATEVLSVNTTDHPEQGCKNALYNVLALMTVAFPPMAYAGLAIIGKIALTFLRAVFSYIYALVLIAFLFMLAPFFLSFYLFKSTQKLFDKWLGYLVSFTLQVVLLFAFLTFILSINVSHITDKIQDIIFFNQAAYETTSFRFPLNYCSVCAFKAVYNDDDPNAGQDIPQENIQDFLSRGKLVCVDSPPKLIDINFASSPNLTGPPSGTNISNELMSFTIISMLSLLVLAYIVDQLLHYVSSLAHTLAGGLSGSYAPQIGGGINPKGVPTIGSPIDRPAEHFADGFHQSMMENKGKAETSLTSIPRAIKDGFTAQATERQLTNDTRKEGLLAGTRRDIGNWFLNPNHNDPRNDD